MSGGRFRICALNREYSLGNILSIKTMHRASLIDTTIPIQTCEQQFVVDNGVRQDITVEFVRIMPQSIHDDSTTDTECWSNGKWMQEMVNLINRWQVDTDGVKIYYIDSGGMDKYPQIGHKIGNVIIGLNAYISEFSPRYEASCPTRISGSIKFSVGGLNANLVGNTRPSVLYVGRMEMDNFGIIYEDDTESFTVAEIPKNWQASVKSWEVVKIDGTKEFISPNTVVRFEELQPDLSLNYLFTGSETEIPPTMYIKEDTYREYTDDTGNPVIDRYITLRKIPHGSETIIVSPQPEGNAHRNWGYVDKDGCIRIYDTHQEVDVNSLYMVNETINGENCRVATLTNWAVQISADFTHSIPWRPPGPVPAPETVRVQLIHEINQPLSLSIYTLSNPGNFKGWYAEMNGPLEEIHNGDIVQTRRPRKWYDFNQQSWFFRDNLYLKYKIDDVKGVVSITANYTATEESRP